MTTWHFMHFCSPSLTRCGWVTMAASSALGSATQGIWSESPPNASAMSWAIMFASRWLPPRVPTTASVGTISTAGVRTGRGVWSRWSASRRIVAARPDADSERLHPPTGALGRAGLLGGVRHQGVEVGRQKPRHHAGHLQAHADALVGMQVLEQRRLRVDERDRAEPLVGITPPHGLLEIGDLDPLGLQIEVDREHLVGEGRVQERGDLLHRDVEVFRHGPKRPKGRLPSMAEHGDDRPLAQRLVLRHAAVLLSRGPAAWRLAL